MKQILNHKDWSEALKLHKIGLQAFFKGNKKTQLYNLNASFDLQCAISSDLKVPLYDIMMLIRTNSTSNFVSTLV